MPKVLIIDDDFAVRTSLSLLLKQNEFDTAAAQNPSEAMSMLRENKFDLIVLGILKMN